MKTCLAAVRRARRLRKPRYPQTGHFVSGYWLSEQVARITDLIEFTVIATLQVLKLACLNREASIVPEIWELPRAFIMICVGEFKVVIFAT